MKVLITGACGFVGSSLAVDLLSHNASLEIIGIDNLSRQGSELNRSVLKHKGIRFLHGDLRCGSDLESIGKVDWIIDCSALPSVLAGTAGFSSSRQQIEHNLVSTINMLEYCRVHQAGFVLLSTSRVYSIEPLTKLPLKSNESQFTIDLEKSLPTGLSEHGISESFSTVPPVSLYGSTKLASEVLAMEYASAFQFPIRINRCGVIAGAGQFARPDQGIFSFWIHSYARQRKLRYIGFQGTGLQVRDVLHPSDLSNLVTKQLKAGFDSSKPILANVSGGMSSARSLRQVSQWCEERYAKLDVEADSAERPFDLPWVVLDSTRASNAWNWRPCMSAEMIFEEIAQHAADNLNWLNLTT